MNLPIDSVLSALRDTLATARRAVLEAPPGAGKTTRVPLALLDATWLAGQRIVLLEPRRLAARAAAARMAAMLGEAVGGQVGYRMRGETRVGRTTRIEVVTEGVLTRMLQEDLGLAGTGLVIFDEFHERSLVADTGLALIQGATRVLRPELGVLVMSATLDGEAVAQLLDDAPQVRSVGRLFPVTTAFAPPRQGGRLEPHVAEAVRTALTTAAGSVLVFLPGAAEIRRVETLLVGGALPGDVTVHPLFGALPPAAQDVAIAPAPPGRRKVVLATNVAETSLTIDGVHTVIDAGFERVPRFSPRTGMTRLETVRITRASADQRRGRAGRTAPGHCIRCWSAADDAGLVPTTRPEIVSADLAPLALDLAIAGFTSPAELPWLDPPPSGAFAAGRALLALLGALDAAGGVTAHGRAMATWGVHPRVAHLLEVARGRNEATRLRVGHLAALLEERDILRGRDGPPPSDLRLRMELLERTNDASSGEPIDVDRAAMARVRSAAAQWHRRLDVAHRAPTDADTVGELLALVYPDRVARRRSDGPRYLLRNGRGASLAPHDALAHTEWLVAADVDDTGRDARIRLAAPLEAAAVRALRTTEAITTDEVGWDLAARRVVAQRITRLGAIEMDVRELARPHADQTRPVWLDVIRREGLSALQWSPAATDMRQRLAFVAAHDPHWPAMDDRTLLERLDEWLGPLLGGVLRWEELARLDVGGALRDLLSWEQRAALDRLAPERLEMPTGSRIALEYGDPAAPVLAVRLQECFGMTTTPRVLDGGVTVVMHLLSPGHRPVQVTTDLASFWRSGYTEVRKELRGRYPKHHWPEDPLTATAVRGVPRRR